MTTAASDLRIVPRPPLRRPCWPWWFMPLTFRACPVPRHGDRDDARLVLAKLLGRVPRLRVDTGPMLATLVNCCGLGHWRLAADRGAAETG